MLHEILETKKKQVIYLQTICRFFIIYYVQNNFVVQIDLNAYIYMYIYIELYSLHKHQS